MRIVACFLSTVAIVLLGCSVRGPALNEQALGCYTVHSSVPAETERLFPFKILPSVIALDSSPEFRLGQRPVLVPLHWRFQGRHQPDASWSNIADDWMLLRSGRVFFPLPTNSFHALRGDSIIVRFPGVVAFLAPDAHGYTGVAQWSGERHYSFRDPQPKSTMSLERTACESLPTLVRGAP